MIKKLISKSLAAVNLRISRNYTREDIAFADQSRIINSDKPKVIFDVGAYNGDTALRYNKLFNENCKIYSFEPFTESYELLKKNTRNHPNILLNKFALGNNNGTINYHSNKFSATNSFLPTAENGKKTWGVGTLETVEKITVPVRTLDSFIVENDIDRIDILKLDTQGTEFMVLEGAENAIKKDKIKLVYTEIIVMPTYEGQKKLDEILKIMRDYGYEIFNFYSAMNAQGQLRYLDALFVYKD